MVEATTQVLAEAVLQVEASQDLAVEVLHPAGVFLHQVEAVLHLQDQAVEEGKSIKK